jgi:hypothetical protein
MARSSSRIFSITWSAADICTASIRAAFDKIGGFMDLLKAMGADDSFFSLRQKFSACAVGLFYDTADVQYEDRIGDCIESPLPELVTHTRNIIDQYS